jgi:hypothetical protein
MYIRHTMVLAAIGAAYLGTAVNASAGNVGAAPVGAVPSTTASMQWLNDVKNTLLGGRLNPGVGGAPGAAKSTGKNSGDGEQSDDGQPPVSAPEMDAGSAASALTLLLGAFAVLYGRRVARRTGA